MNEHSTPSLLGSLWRYRWSSAAVVLALVVLSAAAGLVVGPSAVASASISLTTPRENNVLSPGAQGDASLARYTAQRASFATSDAVLGAVAERLGREELTELREDVTATAASGSNTVVITAEAASPGEAVELADAVVDAYAEQTEGEVTRLTRAAIDSLEASEAQIRDEIGADDALPGEGAAALTSSGATTIGQLRLQASELQTSSALFGDGVEFVEAPRVDAVVTRGFPLREAALGLVLGLVVAGTVAWLRADRNRRITAPEQVEEVLDAPFLGEVRTQGDVQDVGVADVAELPSHVYRMIGTSVQHQMRTGVLVVTSDDAAARTAAVLNLAASFAREQRTVLVVDADAQGAGLSLALGSPRGDGWTSALETDGGDWRADLSRVDAGAGRSFSAISAAAGSHLSDPSSQRVEDVVAEWRREFDVVVVDLPPVTAGALPTAVASAADAGVFVVRQGADVRDLREATRQWGVLRTPLIGYVYANPSGRRRSPAPSA
ncbi:hypothetical protein [uncultured Pseudokineococcus sp.]|uniref:hypothetical protein n=1 Tax=uncultured Pseudokineococcus sp. TaxID=1642928 RepID=UPI002630282E|nr:hypothetical protein [uncultured Pseudokineococcus sp.]